MMYRNHHEYNPKDQEPDYEILRSWLNGETGIDSLKDWLSSIYS